MTEEPANEPSLIVEREYFCSLCSGVAATIRLYSRNDKFELVRLSFTSELTMRGPEERTASVQTLLESGDVAALYQFDLEVACFYCPTCDACYCGKHWTCRDVFDDDDGFFWHDSIRGRCPNGHERMLED